MRCSLGSLTRQLLARHCAGEQASCLHRASCICNALLLLAFGLFRRFLKMRSRLLFLLCHFSPLVFLFTFLVFRFFSKVQSFWIFSFLFSLPFFWTLGPLTKKHDESTMNKPRDEGIFVACFTLFVVFFKLLEGIVKLNNKLILLVCV